VLETAFATDAGSVRGTDALSRPLARPLLWNQLLRRIDGLSGTVPMRWAVVRRFDYGTADGSAQRRAGVPLLVHGRDVLAVQSLDAGQAEHDGATIRGAFDSAEGQVSLLAMAAFCDEPLAFSRREHLLASLDSTCERWRRRVAGVEYDGPWAAIVRRSALALDLLADDGSGALAAAATMGLPERIGGPRNYDYRYAWVRDADLTLEAMLAVGLRDQVHVSLGWMLRTMRRTHPRLRPMYRLSGEPRLPVSQLDLDGYRGSRPVVLGNGAQEQLQLGNYGDVFDMTFQYVEDGHALAPDQGRDLAEAADFLCRVWSRPDSSIWELSDERHYTQSKLACWIALDRALALADRGELPGRSAARWREQRARIGDFLERRCWSEQAGAYARSADSDELDAAVLLAGRGAWLRNRRERLSATIDAIRRELGAGGPLLYRYSGMQGQEGAFLACSFWLADTLARAGRVQEAAETMDALVGDGQRRRPVPRGDRPGDRRLTREPPPGAHAPRARQRRVRDPPYLLGRLRRPAQDRVAPSHAAAAGTGDVLPRRAGLAEPEREQRQRQRRRDQAQGAPRIGHRGLDHDQGDRDHRAACEHEAEREARPRHGAPAIAPAHGEQHQLGGVRGDARERVGHRLGQVEHGPRGEERVPDVVIEPELVERQIGRHHEAGGRQHRERGATAGTGGVVMPARGDVAGGR
jgi:GH15 family glucan-1,4-alpha-glucosidase